jgi:hypothetical protein
MLLIEDSRANRARRENSEFGVKRKERDDREGKREVDRNVVLCVYTIFACLFNRIVPVGDMRVADRTGPSRILMRGVHIRFDRS